MQKEITNVRTDIGQVAQSRTASKAKQLQVSANTRAAKLAAAPRPASKPTWFNCTATHTLACQPTPPSVVALVVVAVHHPSFIYRFLSLVRFTALHVGTLRHPRLGHTPPALIPKHLAALGSNSDITRPSTHSHHLGKPLFHLSHPLLTPCLLPEAPPFARRERSPYLALVPSVNRHSSCDTSRTPLSTRTTPPLKTSFKRPSPTRAKNTTATLSTQQVRTNTRSSTPNTPLASMATCSSTASHRATASTWFRPSTTRFSITRAPSRYLASSLVRRAICTFRGRFPRPRANSSLHNSRPPGSRSAHDTMPTSQRRSRPCSARRTRAHRRAGPNHNRASASSCELHSLSFPCHSSLCSKRPSFVRLASVFLLFSLSRPLYLLFVSTLRIFAMSVYYFSLI